jgi:hypothetical protein
VAGDYDNHLFSGREAFGKGIGARSETMVKRSVIFSIEINTLIPYTKALLAAVLSLDPKPISPSKVLWRGTLLLPD